MLVVRSQDGTCRHSALFRCCCALDRCTYGQITVCRIMLPANVLLDDAVSAWAESHRCGDERSGEREISEQGWVVLWMWMWMCCTVGCVGGGLLKVNMINPDKAEKRSDQESTL